MSTTVTSPTAPAAGVAAPDVYHQNNRNDLAWEGPGGKAAVLDLSHSAQLSEVDLTRVTLAFDHVLDARDLLQRHARVVLRAGDFQRERRCFAGIITQVSQTATGHQHIQKADRQRFHYQITLSPPLVLLAHVHRSRVYQNQSVPEIVGDLLHEQKIAHEWRLHGVYQAREYCVQYDESNLTFVQRLLEAQGLYFFYDHDQERLVIVDHMGAHQACRPDAVARYCEHFTALKERDSEGLRSAHFTLRLDSGRVAYHDYNYRTSQVNLTEQGGIRDSAVNPNLEIYRHNMLHADNESGAAAARLEQEIIAAGLSRLVGDGNTRSFAVGFVFDMTNHFDPTLNKKWLITELQVQAEQGDYHCRYQAVPYDRVYRKPQTTPTPKVRGLQTGVITGPPGSPVYLDPLGRCKVQFHWDREGGFNDRSSMWMRVNNNYAGKNYGMQFIPRVGHEVLVEFLEGNPDHPVVIGRVYNDDQTPPLGPAQKYQNGFKSIKDHHFLMDDTDGSERIDLRAARNMDVEVVNNHHQSVGNSELLQVAVDQNETIGGNRTINVGGNDTLNVGNDRNVTVQNDQNFTVEGNQSVTVTGDQTNTISGQQTETITRRLTESVGTHKLVTVGGSFLTTAGYIRRTADNARENIARNWNIDVGERLRIVCGASSLTLEQDGTITLEGTTVNITGSNRVQITGGRIDLN